MSASQHTGIHSVRHTVGYFAAVLDGLSASYAVRHFLTRPPKNCSGDAVLPIAVRKSSARLMVLSRNITSGTAHMYEYVHFKHMFPKKCDDLSSSDSLSILRVGCLSGNEREHYLVLLVPGTTGMYMAVRTIPVVHMIQIDDVK